MGDKKRTVTNEELAKLPTLCVGQRCSLKMDDGAERVWLCRVAGGITVERLVAGCWMLHHGSCTYRGPAEVTL